MKRFLTVLLFLLPSLSQAQLLVDQQSIPGTISISREFSVASIAGQTFVPTASNMDYWSMDSWGTIFDKKSVSITLTLHSGNDASGAVLAQSGILHVESFTEIQLVGDEPFTFYYMPEVEWKLTETVALTPGATYTVFMEAISGDTMFLPAYLDAYGNGDFILNSESFPGQSLAFTQGQVIPEPSAYVLVLIGLVLLVNRKYRTMRSTEHLPAAHSVLGRFAPGMDRATGRCR